MVPDDIKAEFAAGKIYKDGYFEIGCIKDYMYYHGDKFGNNKFSYEIGAISHVSIIFPLDYVPKSDQKPMTVAYCYSMCRQLSSISFFGIMNGKDCYCTPYVKAMAGDDSTCTQPCEGDKGAMCGSATKSTVFQMHSCDDTAVSLQGAMTSAGTLITKLDDLSTPVKEAGEMVDKTAAAMKDAFGKVGDPEVSNLFQESLSVGSSLKMLAGKCSKLKTTMQGTSSEATTIEAEDLTVSANADKADAIMATIEGEKASAEMCIADMTRMMKTVAPAYEGGMENTTNASAQYYPIMYFVNKDFVDSPTSCSGKLLATYVGVSKDECAASCDGTSLAGCMGFFYVPKEAATPEPKVPNSFCFTFSAITSIQYYKADCAEKAASMCYGKFSKLEGTSPLDKTRGQKAVSADSRCMPGPTTS